MEPKPATAEAVKVVVRMRPFNTREKDLKCKQVVDCFTEDAQVHITKPGGDPEVDRKTFKFDAVYDLDSTQRAVYDETAMPLVESVLEGYNGTIFAYGQTGCGKTFTMEGMAEPKELRGVTPNSFDHIFDQVASDSGTGKKYLVTAQYLEIYNEEIHDLLGPNPTEKMELKEDPERGVFVKGLTQGVVKTSEEIDSVMKAGAGNRTTAATLMNATSSRSHSIFTVLVETQEEVDGLSGDDAKASVKRGKLNLVDLAGSERVSKTGAVGARFKEGTKINLSLSALGNVISALVDGKSKHIPYRTSKLTRLLQDSLGGNTKTVMVACFSPADNNYDETLSTLRYANRAKNIKNKPRINEDPKDALLREFQEEIQRLKAMLEAQAAGGIAIQVPMPSAPASASAPHDSDRSAPLLTAGEIQKQREEMTDRNNEVEALKKQQDDYNAQLGDMKNMAEAQKLELEAKKREIDERQAELLKKERAHEEERKKREEMEHRLRSAEEMMLQQEANVQKKVNEKLETERLRMEAAARLEKRKQRRAEILLKKKKHEEEMTQLELEYIEEQKVSVESDLEALKADLEKDQKVIKKLKGKIANLKTETVDLQSEFEDERTHYLDLLKNQQRDMVLLEQIVQLFVPPKILNKIERNAQWDDEYETWKIPPSCMPQHKVDIERVRLPSVDDNRSVSAPRKQRPSSAGGLIPIDGAAQQTEGRSRSAVPQPRESGYQSPIPSRPNSSSNVRGPPQRERPKSMAVHAIEGASRERSSSVRAARGPPSRDRPASLAIGSTRERSNSTTTRNAPNPRRQRPPIDNQGQKSSGLTSLPGSDFSMDKGASASAVKKNSSELSSLPADFSTGGGDGSDGIDMFSALGLEDDGVTQTPPQFHQSL